MKSEDKAKADCAGDKPHLNGIAAEIGPDGAFLDDRERCRQRAGAEQHRQILRCPRREAAADLPRAAGDRLADHRRAEHLSVEHDRERLADIGAGDFGEAARALGVEPESDDRFAGLLVEGRGGIDQPIAFQHGAAPDRIQLVAAPLDPRQQLDPGRQPRAALQARPARTLIEKMKGHLRRGAEKRLDPARVLNARQLDDQPVAALAHDRRLDNAGFVDTPPDDFEALLERGRSP